MADRPSETEARVIVTDFYRTLLGREPDHGGLTHYTKQLTDGASPASIRTIFLEGDEYLSRQRLLGLDSLADYDALQPDDRFPEDYQPVGEAGRCYLFRVRSGFFHRYCNGPMVLDVGFTGYDNPERKPALKYAIGVDLDYPGYDGIHLPFAAESIDTVFSSHCLEHILYDHAAIQDWYRVLKVGGHIVCMVPSQALYEKKRFLPSRWNGDHKRMYSPAALARSFEEALRVNSYRVRHLAENDRGFNYSLGPDVHSDGAYEIEIVIEKIAPPPWTLD